MSKQSESIPGTYVFALKETLSETEIRKLFSGYEIKSLDSISEKNRTYKIVFEKDPGLPALEKNNASSGKILYIEPNYIYRAN